MSYIFDYDTFFRHYTNIDNLLYSESSDTLYFYNYQKVVESVKLSDYFIEIQGVKLYVSWRGNNHKVKNDDILFTIPKKIDGKLWDDHFHFAYNQKTKNVSRKAKDVSLIAFAKTIQIPADNRKDSSLHRCNFRDKQEDLRTIQDIICTNHSTGSTMSDQLHSQDLQIIKEILTRPFIQNAGTQKINYKNALYKIRTGPNNGKYIVVKGKKVYLGNKYT